MNSRTLFAALTIAAGLIFAGCTNTPHPNGGGGKVTSANFTFYVTGLESGTVSGTPAMGANFYAIVGVVVLNSNGDVTGGELDYNDAFGVTSPATKITGGNLTQTAGTQQGTLTLVTGNAALGAAGTLTFAIQVINDNHGLIIQYDGSATSSGSFDLQTLGTPTGNFAFTFSGVDPSYNPAVGGGIFSISGTNIQNGKVDVNDNGTVTFGTTFSGSIPGPDNLGRGIITLTNFSAEVAVPAQVTYYVLNSNVIRIIDMDRTDSAVGSAYSQGTGTFSPSIGSFVFSVNSNSWANILFSVAGMGTARAAAPAVPASVRKPEGIGPTNNVNGVADVNEAGTLNSPSPAPITGFIAAATNGYARIIISSDNLLGITSLGTYLTSPSLNLIDPNNTTSGTGGALLADLDGNFPGTGFLVTQFSPPPTSFSENFGFGAQVFNGGNNNGWEVDFLGQTPISSLTFGSPSPGFLNDPFATLSSVLKSTVTFTGIVNPDGANPGRYTMEESSHLIATYNGMTVPFSTVIYQASGEYLTWMEFDDNSVFSGSLQQLTSATAAAVPAEHLLRILHH